MICIAFQELLTFPFNRTELYQEALEALLKKWDSSRAIERATVYRNLTLRKKELFFEKLAATTFQREMLYFKKSYLIKEIDGFLSNLIPDDYTGDAESVLQSIEIQHGLLCERSIGEYSFSHLTFHEYFTARYIDKNNKTDELVELYLFNRRWAEVFIMTSALLSDATCYVEKIQSIVNNIVLGSASLNLLRYSDTIDCSLKDFPASLQRAISLGHILSRLEMKTRSRGLRLALESCDELTDTLYRCYKNHISQSIAQLRTFELGIAEVRNTLEEYADDMIASHDLDSLGPSLEKYLYGNKILMTCMVSDCYMDKNVREKIADSFLFVS